MEMYSHRAAGLRAAGSKGMILANAGVPHNSPAARGYADSAHFLPGLRDGTGRVYNDLRGAGKAPRFLARSHKIDATDKSP